MSSTQDRSNRNPNPPSGLALRYQKQPQMLRAVTAMSRMAVSIRTCSMLRPSLGNERDKQGKLPKLHRLSRKTYQKASTQISSTQSVLPECWDKIATPARSILVPLSRKGPGDILSTTGL